MLNSNEAKFENFSKILVHGEEWENPRIVLEKEDEDDKIAGVVN